MKILVDADACPVKKIIVREARQRQIPVIMIIDSSHILQDGYSQVITVDQGTDSADFKLISLTEPGDLVVTQDFGVAAMALSKGASALNQNGLIFTSENIDQLLFERHIGKELRRDLYHHVQLLSMENIDRLRPSSIITRITNDVAQIQDFINSIMRMMVKAPITCIGAVILIMIQTPGQAPVMAVIILIVALLVIGNMKIGYPRFGTVQKRLDRLNGVAREFLSSVRVVKAFHAEEVETEKFEEVSAELAGANTAALRTMAVFSPFISLTVNFGIVLLLWISENRQSAEIGRLMASVNYMTQVLFSATMISNTLNTAVRATASAARIKEVLEEQPAQRVPERPLRPEIRGDIRFGMFPLPMRGREKNRFMIFIYILRRERRSVSLALRVPERRRL